MKKIFALLAIFVLVLVACEQPTDDNNQGQTSKLPSLTIKNESSFDLTDVKFSGISFSSSGSNELPHTTQSVKQLTENDLNKVGYITFVRKDIGISLRTEALSVAEQDLTFTFLNTTVVEEQLNSSNKGTLAQISFLSQVAVERGGLSVSTNDSVNLGEMVINTVKEDEFTLKNTGTGKLLLSGNEPVKINNDSTGVFSVVQPSRSEIAANSSLPFKIKFIPKDVQTYTATVTINSNDKNSPYTFTITAIGTPRKPIAVVEYENNPILQNGTINAGNEFLTKSKNISVVIKNTGLEPLSIDTANITITGADALAFVKTTNPGSSVSAGGQTSFYIECRPIKQGENNAILTIPTNDGSRNPITVLLRITGVKGAAILGLSQGTTVITDNSLTPFDFGKVDLGTDKTLVFTIKNTGNISLELTGTPTVESSSTVFSVSTQPASKTIVPDDTTSFIIKYTPTAEGENIGSFTITNNSDAIIFTLNVKGTGYVKKPQINIQQGTSTIPLYGDYDFGTIASGKTKDIVFTVRNSGDANLNFITENNNRINIADNTSGFFTVTQQPSASTIVTPGNTTTFTVRFSPTTIGANFTATVQIKTNSRENDEFSFRVKGTARAANTEARLSGLQFSTGTLNPQFNSGIYTYTLRIQEGPTLINAQPTSMDANITSIKVNGISQNSGVLSQDIILASTSVVTIVVTAEDGVAAATYTVNLKIVKTWEKLYGASGRRYGIYRAISNGEGGIYAGGYTSNNTAALFNIDRNGNILNTFTFSSYSDSSYSTLGPVGMGSVYNDYFAVYESPTFGDYYLTKTTSPSIRPTTTQTSLLINNKKMYMYPRDMVRNSSGYYFVVGNTDYYATSSATDTTYGMFIIRHLSNGNYDMGKSLSLTITGITANSYEVYGMALLTNGDILLYGEADKSGRSVAFAAAVDVSASSTASWTIRWSNTYEITNKITRFTNCFWDNSSNIVLLGETDDGGFVVKFPGSATTAAAAKPTGWPKVVTGTQAGFFAGLAATDGSGYIFVGSANGSYGSSDIWAVKTDVNANKTWEKFYGGTGNEWGMAVVEQTDGFIIAGATTSPIISGQSKTGTEDIYILKINKDGTLD